MREKSTTTDPLLILVDSAGDLWRVWPTVGACEIDDEDDLRDPAAISKLEPSRAALDRIAGPTAELIVYRACHECGGSGRYEGPDVLWSSGFNRDEQGEMYREAPVAIGRYRGEQLRRHEFVGHGSVRCDDCNGSGRQYHYSGERVAVAPLVEGAA